MFEKLISAIRTESRATDTNNNPLSIFSLQGRTAFVTGAGSGLGREIALSFVAAGATVIAADIDQNAVIHTVETARESGWRIFGASIDVSDVRSVEESVGQAVSEVESIDVLVNAAGIGGWGPSTTYAPELWERVIGVNLTGTFNCCQVVGDHMVSSGFGSIVNVASTLGLAGFPGTIGYVASKGGVVQLTRALAVEWAAAGVRVNALAPSTFETPLVETNRARRPEVYEKLLSLTPLGRLGRIGEIVGPALFLASEASSMVTGHVLAVDGGYLAQ